MTSSCVSDLSQVQKFCDQPPILPANLLAVPFEGWHKFLLKKVCCSTCFSSLLMHGGLRNQLLFLFSSICLGIPPWFNQWCGHCFSEYVLGVISLRSIFKLLGSKLAVGDWYYLFPKSFTAFHTYPADFKIIAYYSKNNIQLIILRQHRLPFSTFERWINSEQLKWWNLG